MATVSDFQKQSALFSVALECARKSIAKKTTHPEI
jgi:hypothetical protein